VPPRRKMVKSAFLIVNVDFRDGFLLGRHQGRDPSVA
jgi:hypothetical protein